MSAGKGVESSLAVLRFLLSCFASKIKQDIDEESIDGVATVKGMERDFDGGVDGRNFL